jgi:hypothetical protein
VAVAVHEGHGIGRLARALTFLGGLAALGIAVADALDVSSRSGDYVQASIGIGLFVVGLGGVLALAESAISDSRPRA